MVNNKRRGKKFQITFEFRLTHCSSLSAKARRVTGKFCKHNELSKMEGKTHKKSKHPADLRGVCPIRDNAGAHKFKLVQNFLEAENVVQHPNLTYSSDLSPCDFFSC